jgi:alpha-mannosidase
MDLYASSPHPILTNPEDAYTNISPIRRNPMQKHRKLTQQRIQSFASDQQLGSRIYKERHPIELSSYAAPGRISYETALRGKYTPIEIGHHFQPVWSTHWVRADIKVPIKWTGQEVHLLWDSTSEACVWDEQGQPLQGLTGSGNSWISGSIRPEYRLISNTSGGESMTVYIEVACNGLFGNSFSTSDINLTGYLRKAEIAVFDPEAWDLYWDFRVIADMAEHLPEDSPRAGQALYTANAIVNVVDQDDPSTWEEGRKIAADFYASHNGDSQHHLSAVGHAHIDTAWLWPLAETMRKCVRTFSTAVRYMEDYPDYIFACSQAQQYEWMKEQQPGLYEKIKAKVAEGRFIPTGGSWVEPDTNIPSGESLVRQFVFGQRYFQSEFGITCQEFWVPDVFGYSATLPQIMQQAGIRYFLTQKMSWNQFNKIPSHTFLWEGLDGSQVLTHFPPVDTYNSVANVKEILFNISNYKDHDRSNHSYLLFGYGDGGGGPTRAMLEQLNRMADVDGLPQIAQRTPNDFFQRLEADIKDPITWRGELYFEYHRGTYTTQADTKRDNRRSEELLHDIEFLAAIANANYGLPYPADTLARLWKIVLTNQFHDIIPGSSITEVYQDSAKDYQEVLSTGADLRQEVAAAFLKPASGPSDRIAVINTLSVERTELVDLPVGMSSAQHSSTGQPLGIVSAPSMGVAVVKPATQPSQPVQISKSQDGYILENQFVAAKFNVSGQLTSLFDKQNRRECIEPHRKANQFVLFDDNPIKHDAWDVDIYHLEKFKLIPPAHSTEAIEEGPLRASLAFEIEISPKSRLRQVVSLTALSPRLAFTTDVDWHEDHKFLKVEFPLNLHADYATYEIQFGHLRRPTHFNNSWDMARFEVCAQHWADFSEPDFGVSLLNDSKYGYSVHDNVMRLSLLRSPKMPDPQADMGTHSFRYALLPHADSPIEAGVIEEGYRFNSPLLIYPSLAELQSQSFFRVSGGSLVLDTVKKAEDSDAIILRIYEAHGKRGTCRLESSLPVSKAVQCNLLETDESQLPWDENGVEIPYAPFQLITLKLYLR